MEDVETTVTVDTNTEGDTQHQDSPEETVESLKEKLEREQDARRQLNARAKRAEEELKTLKNAPSLNSNPQLSEELKLIARGLSDEEIEKAKIIAKGNGTNLTEALKDDMFLAFQAKVQEDKRKEQAKLGASKGSGESEPAITGFEAGATREEHMAAFKKVTGKK